MDTVFFADLKKITNIEFYCFTCGWHGGESKLRKKISQDPEISMVCCPACHNEDVRVYNEEWDE